MNNIDKDSSRCTAHDFLARRSQCVREILVTSALPYANGALHLGHMMEYIQPDIWVRFQKMRGQKIIFVCGSDTHGTPIMLQAQRQNTTPEQLVAEMHAEHAEELAKCHIEFDNFYTTHSDENRELSAMIFKQLEANGDIRSKRIEQSFDEVKQMFLPDRFVKGECPRCNAVDQYGDSCDVCGATYSPTELKNPLSMVSNTTPIRKKSEHLFFNLQNYAEHLKTWTSSGRLQKEVSNKLKEWFETGLQAWDISRDAPYFGFEIPGHPSKYFYVWLDAPIGYMASFKNLCTKRADLNFDKYWQINSDVELYHFIGKDIVYFHALFWPAILMAAKLRTPSAIFAHGFLTVNGTKMSKSKGTFVKIKTYLQQLPAEYLRYYFASKLTAKVEDIDLNLQDFAQKINADLVGKIVNLASRSAKFINSYFNSQLSNTLPNPNLFEQFSDNSELIAQCYEQRDFAKALREIMHYADLANQYIDEQKPWILCKKPETFASVQEICTQCINHFRQLIVWLKPVLPNLALKVEAFLAIAPLTWADAEMPLLNHSINSFSPLLERIQPHQVGAIFMSKADDTLQKSIGFHHETESNLEFNAVSANQENQASKHATFVPIKPEISIEDFAKVDLRVAKIIDAQSVEGADKLVKLTLDLGGVEKQVFAGIKNAYTPESLINRYTVMVANLAPRKMRFGLSEGMVLAASCPEEPSIFILTPDAGAKPGMLVK